MAVPRFKRLKTGKGDTQMPMYTSDTGGSDFAQLEEGTHIAVCDALINLGNQRTEWEGDVKWKKQVFIRFQVPAERTTWTDKDGNEKEGPMSVSAWLTNSLGEKANLRQYLEAWRGKAFTQKELDRFDLSTILGKACQVSVKHTKGGKAKVAAVMALPKGMTAPELEGEVILYDLADAPDGWDAVPMGLKKICAKAEPSAAPGGWTPDGDREPGSDDGPVSNKAPTLEEEATAEIPF